MKKLTLTLLIVSLNAIADEHYSHHNHYNNHRGYGNGYQEDHRRDGDDWILPAILGGAILGSAVYGYSRPPTPPPAYYYPPAPVYQQVPPVYPAIPYGYHQQSVFDPNCNCYKYALVPN